MTNEKTAIEIMTPLSDAVTLTEDNSVADAKSVMQSRRTRSVLIETAPGSPTFWIFTMDMYNSLRRLQNDSDLSERKLTPPTVKKFEVYVSAETPCSQITQTLEHHLSDYALVTIKRQAIGIVSHWDVFTKC